MPNWCFTNMVVIGSPTEIKDLYNKLTLAKEEAKKNNHWSLYEIFAVFNCYTKEQILEDSKLGYNRGTIYDIHLDNESTLRVYYESAWGPMIEGFNYLLQHHYKTLKQYSLAEECGNEVFINTDTTGKFFPQKWRLYIEDVDDFYLTTDEEVLDTVEKYCKERFDSISELLQAIEDNETIGGEYVSLNAFGNY